MTFKVLKSPMMTAPAEANLLFDGQAQVQILLSVISISLRCRDVFRSDVDLKWAQPRRGASFPDGITFRLLQESNDIHH